MDLNSIGQDKIEKIIEVFLKKNKKNTQVKELDKLPTENKALYSLITSDNEKYVICIYDINEQTQQAIYWMDRYTHYGKIVDVFSDEYITLIIYSRGQDYKNEYLIKHYNQKSGYPLTELIPENEYAERLSTIKELFSKVN